MTVLEVHAGPPSVRRGADRGDHERHLVVGADLGADLVARQVASRLGTRADALAQEARAEEGRCAGVAVVPSVPGPGGDGDIAATLKPPLHWLVRQVQRLQPTLASPAGIVLMLPVVPTMGDRAHVLGSAFCGAVLSLARTWAIELQRDGVGVNCLMYDEHDGEILQPEAVVAQLQALWAAPGISGQQIFVDAGTSLGRLHP